MKVDCEVEGLRMSRRQMVAPSERRRTNIGCDSIEGIGPSRRPFGLYENLLSWEDEEKTKEEKMG